MLIRHILSVPETLRACAPRQRRKPRRLSFPEQDAWAMERAEELQKQNISARVRRFGRNQSLCVVYRANEKGVNLCC
jgi:hypothetical protein